MSSQKQNSATAYLQSMLNTIAPKSKYISEMHVEEYVDEICLQIINGDTEVNKQSTPLLESAEGKNKSKFEEQLKKKILSQAQKQKALLEQKLSYLTNSINHLNKTERVKRRNNQEVQIQAFSPEKDVERWKKQMEQRSKILQKKRKLAEQGKAKKAEQIKEMEERVKRQEAEKKKKQILEHVKTIQERSKSRMEQIRQSHQRYKQMKKQKSLHQRLSQNYNQKQLSFLEQRKKKLAEIRNLHKPLDEEQLKEHEQRFLQGKKQKQSMRERQKRMNQSRSSSLQPFYKSVFYQKVIEDSRNEVENAQQAKQQKIKQYSQRIKQRFAPQIDEKKKNQIQQFIQKQKQKAEQKQQKYRQLLELPKQKGNQYLELVKSLPKKKKRKSSVDLSQSKSSRKQYPNYLTHNENQPNKPWHSILKSSVDKQQKALLLQYQSQKYEEQLKRKQEQIRIMKKGDSGQIDKGYFDMIKAKLDLLAAE